MIPHKIVSEREWTVARKGLLTKEKELTKLRDQLSEARLALPWVKVQNSYVFDAPEGKVTLAQLFDGRSQLFVKHFMMGPGQNWQCVGCYFEVHHIEGIIVHLENHDVTYVAVARAPIEEIEVIRKRMGWGFRSVSSYNSDFNYDFNVSFRPEEVAAGHTYYNYSYTDPGVEDLPGYSVFFKNDSGQIFHTYSTYGRGVEEFMGAYRFLDATPKGRNENGPNRDLRDWVRLRIMYGKRGIVEGNGRDHTPGCACNLHK